MTALQETDNRNGVSHGQSGYDWHIIEGTLAQGAISNAKPDFQKLGWNQTVPPLCLQSTPLLLLSPSVNESSTPLQTAASAG